MGLISAVCKKETHLSFLTIYHRKWVEHDFQCSKTKWSRVKEEARFYYVDPTNAMYLILFSFSFAQFLLMTSNWPNQKSFSDFMQIFSGSNLVMVFFELQSREGS